MASVVDPRPITARQIEILRWIDTQPHDHSIREWNDALTLKGPNGSITISVHDNDRLHKMVKPNPDREGFRQKHFVLSAAGRKALSREKAE